MATAAQQSARNAVAQANVLERRGFVLISMEHGPQAAHEKSGHATPGPKAEPAGLGLAHPAVPATENLKSLDTPDPEEA
jgi:hypothetical protein